ncbi:tumor necrosis factor receptor superfamily member 9a [Echeneis naucrates]|uniref:tumor necrosis factor receptor superfamily member 9a n=1 Tax=Echeneis naucrates TaxID=173247 RepID=UPI001113D198|nr:tumor necrosis factor receptor superfamily member 23-like [Echeneis naucrates]
MAVILLVMGLSLLMQGCLSIPAQNDQGCVKWQPDPSNTSNVCCDSCHPGHRVYQKCGPRPKELCKPCKPGTFTLKDNSLKCERCTECAGAQVLLKECTATADTQCGCREGLKCGDSKCSFCVQKCNKGEQPTKNRSCEPCPEGTFNNQIHQRCKPQITECPRNHVLIKGNATTESECQIILLMPSIKPTATVAPERMWPLVTSLVTSLALIGFCVVIGVSVAMKAAQNRKKASKVSRKGPVIRVPTDEPMTLRAVECSFHEAQQEQGSSSESLDSKDSSGHLLA